MFYGRTHNTVPAMHAQIGSPNWSTVPATSDAKAYLRLLLEHKLGLIGAVIAGALLAFVYLATQEPIYEASALVEVRERGNLLDRDDDRDRQFDWDAPTIKEEANILNSRRVLAPVVDAYDLRTEVEAERVPILGDLVRSIEPLSEWFRGLDAGHGYSWGDDTLVLAALELPPEWEDERLTVVSLGDGNYALRHDERTLIERASVGEALTVDLDQSGSLSLEVALLDAPEGVRYEVRRRSLEQTIRAVRASLSTEASDSDSRMLTVTYRGRDPQETAILANAIVSQYQAVKLGSESLETTAEREFFDQSLPQVEAALREAELALSDYRRSAGSIDQDTQIAGRLGQLDRLEREMTDMQIDRDELLERYTNLHPSTRRLDTDIAVLQRKIDEVRASIQNAPDTDRELTVLMQDEETARRVFNEMNERLQRLRVAEAGNVGSVQIWDEALPPRRPVSPDAKLALVGSVVATTFLYLLFVMLRSALSTTMHDPESLERVTGLPVFMNIPKSAVQRRLNGGGARRLLARPGSGSDAVAAGSVLALRRPDDFAVENLRGLRSMVGDMLDDAPNNAIMFTSPLPGMGKSFVSLNLAVLLAQSGKRVLLIDADYHRGALHEALGLDNGPGLPEVVSGRAELKDAIRSTSVAQLYCLSRGFSGADPARDLPGDRAMRTFMQVVAPRFDTVIVDTPPVLSVATAAALARHAGSTVLVLKEGKVKEGPLLEALKRLDLSGARVRGCVLNASAIPTPRHYTYYREQYR